MQSQQNRLIPITAARYIVGLYATRDLKQVPCLVFSISEIVTEQTISPELLPALSQALTPGLSPALFPALSQALTPGLSPALSQ